MNEPLHRILRACTSWILPIALGVVIILLCLVATNVSTTPIFLYSFT